jgi:polyketide synthase PksL
MSSQSCQQWRIWKWHAPHCKTHWQVELQHVAWAQAITVTSPTLATIAVFQDEGAADGQLGFEVFTQQGAEEVMHCQGSAVLVAAVAAPSLDLAQLRQRMQGGSMSAADIYPAFAKLGLQYGPAYQGITQVLLGAQELLVELQLPSSASGQSSQFAMHPCMMDSALQGSICLAGDLANVKPALPFAVESVRMYQAGSEQMLAWVRYSAGSSASASMTKVDIDVCDSNGSVCVQLRGFSSRAMEAGNTFDEAHYQAILAGILSNTISVDQAVELGKL